MAAAFGVRQAGAFSRIRLPHQSGSSSARNFRSACGAGGRLASPSVSSFVSPSGRNPASEIRHIPATLGAFAGTSNSNGDGSCAAVERSPLGALFVSRGIFGSREEGSLRWNHLRKPSSRTVNLAGPGCAAAARWPTRVAVLALPAPGIPIARQGRPTARDCAVLCWPGDVGAATGLRRSHCLIMGNSLAARLHFAAPPALQLREVVSAHHAAARNLAHVVAQRSRMNACRYCWPPGPPAPSREPKLAK